MTVQKRGLERRRHILSVARKLLKEYDLSLMTLADVAKESGVPVSSIYHFYPSVLDIYRSLAEQFKEELAGLLEEQFQRARLQREMESWQQLVDCLIDGSAQFYLDHYEFQQLILSGKAPAQIKQMDRNHDNALAKLMISAFEDLFKLPEMPNIEDIVFNSIEVVDLFFSIDVYRHQRITPEGCEEAKRAVRSYMRNYFPEYLPLAQ